LPKAHFVNRETFHYKFSRDHKPALHIKRRDKVTFQVNDVTSWQIAERTTAEEMMNLDMDGGLGGSRAYPLAGPVYVEGAQPGDALVVDVVDVKAGGWGWTAIMPGVGLLEEFTKPLLWIWKLKSRRYAQFKNGIRIPVRPYCGVMGVAPAEEGTFDVLHSQRLGHLDCRHLTAGSRFMLPVFVDGALFSVGDVHAAQGDGEICGFAIECGGEATLAFDINKNAGLESPAFLTKNEQFPRKGYYVTIGVSDDLMEAARQAVRSMINYLSKGYELTREEAYVLCSVAADLRIHCAVASPVLPKVVGAMIPRDIFPRS